MNEQRKAVIRWLLESDPSSRWQVMRDLMGESDQAIQCERTRVATEGWGARLLDLQALDGQWGGGPYHPCWTGTLCTLLLLKEMGLDPASGRTRAAINLIREKCTWEPEFGCAPLFEGEVEPCINGNTLAVGAYFGVASERLLDRLLGNNWRTVAGTAKPHQAYDPLFTRLFAFWRVSSLTSKPTAGRVR
jgi:hypothetical protein